MLSTVVMDAFSIEQCAGMVDAVEELCPPDTTGPFGCAGLYSFWAPETKELLYIGLARDLGFRLRQHTGLVQCPEAACKVRETRGWFERNELLGYSLMPTSPLDVADVARTRKKFLEDPRSIEAVEELGLETANEIRTAEGELLHAHEELHGSLPPWNKIRGQRVHPLGPMKNHAPLLDFMRGRYRHAMTAHRTISQLAADPQAQEWEHLLHVARYEMVIRHGGGDDALLAAEVERWSQRSFPGAERFAALLQSGYLDTWKPDSRPGRADG